MCFPETIDDEDLDARQDTLYRRAVELIRKRARRQSLISSGSLVLDSMTQPIQWIFLRHAGLLAPKLTQADNARF